MSEEVIRDIPPFYIILLITNGFLIILLTPLHIPLQTWINPFSQNNPSEALSSIALLLVFSAITGSLGILMNGSLIGNNGLNARLNYKKYKKYQEKLTPLALEEAVWYRNNDAINDFIKFLNIKTSIINGVIIGAELAFIINIPFSVDSIFASHFNAAALLMIMPLIFGLSALLYDKYHFRNELNQAKGVIHDLFTKSTKENASEKTQQAH